MPKPLVDEETFERLPDSVIAFLLEDLKNRPLSDLFNDMMDAANNAQSEQA